MAFLLVAALLSVGCGEDEGEGRTASALPGELTISSLPEDEQRQFCDWFEAALPPEEACHRNGDEGEAPPTCLENIAHFGSCTVETVERCIASASASSCELPETEACEAFRACQEEAAPANDCPDHGFDCKRVRTDWTGKGFSYPTCWSWWPLGCRACHFEDPSWSELEAWCTANYPKECGDGKCFPSGPGMGNKALFQP